jgi:hypothetical protein
MIKEIKVFGSCFIQSSISEEFDNICKITLKTKQMRKVFYLSKIA